MLDSAFKNFRSQVFALYFQKAYAEAQALIDQQASTFSQFESDLFYWRACLAGCMGDKVGALGWLGQAADRGWWYHERLLRDPDLTILRETEELTQLQVVFQERFQVAQAESQSQRQTWEPKGRPRGVLIALHGASGSILTEGDYWRPATDLGWRVAAAQSSQLWAPGCYHWADANQATEELRQHLVELGPAESTVLGGFSMGGGLAVRSVLSGSVSAQCFLVVAPAFRVGDIELLIKSADRLIRGYIVIGKEDSSHQPALQVAALMKDAGLQCTVEEHPDLGHDYPTSFTSSLRQGLSFLAG